MVLRLWNHYIPNHATMKKTLISLLLTVFALGTNCMAQTEDFTHPVIWGIKGNLGAELPSRWRADGNSQKMYNSGFGASIGGLANIYLGKHFYFEPELALFYEGYSYNDIRMVAPNSPSVNVGPDIHKLGVRVPLNFGYFINISDTWGIAVFTGPELNCAFWGNSKATSDEVKGDYDYTHLYSGKYAQRRCDLAWNVGVGFPVRNFMISLEADFGITDILKNEFTCRENRVGLGITYYFPSKTESTTE